ncbi:MAG: hypothetical protein KF764_08385 [Labilithrix sp.]|nr:hypothetical protein [Labilithrix sp.]
MGRFAPVLFLAATVLASVHCYGPTEVTVDLSTDLTCDARPLTRVYKGEVGRFENEPDVETSACTSEPEGARIGTLVVVPSGSRDGRAAIKAVLARNGKSPADCTPDNLADCIVATRAFSFVANSSRRIPIRLFKECVGTICAEGQTCIAGGKCVSDSVACEESDCALPEERPPPGDGGPPPIDLDAGADVTAPVPGDCRAPDGTDTLTTTLEMPGDELAVTSATAHLFVTAKDPTRVVSIPKTGGPLSYAFEIPPALFGAAAKILALGVDGTSPLVAYDDVNGAHHVLTAVDDSILTSSLPPVSVFGALDAVGGRVFTATEGTVYRRVLSSWEKLVIESSGLRRVAVTATTIYLQTADKVVYAAPRVAGTPISQMADAPLGFFAHDGTSVFVGGASRVSLDRGAIVRLVGNKGDVAVIRGNLTAVPQSLAVDSESVFFSAGAAIYRVAKAGGNDAPVAVATIDPDAKLAHLAVDPSPAGCLYYWTVGGSSPARLVIRPKVNLPSSGGI